MAKIDLDLSKFKHISKDGDTHTLQHYEGHEIKLNAKKLSKPHKEALMQMADKSKSKPIKKMAEGGDVDADAMPAIPPALDPNASPEALLETKAQDQAVSTPPPQDEGMEAKKALYNSKMPGYVVGQEGQPFPDQQFGKNGAPPKVVNPEVWNQVKQEYNTQQTAAQITGIKEQQAAHDKAVAQNETNKELGLPEVPVPPAPNSAQEEPIKQDIQSNSQASNAQPQGNQSDLNMDQGYGKGIPSAEGMLTQGYTNAMQGMQKEAAAKGALGQAQAKLIDQRVADEQLAQANYQNSYKALEQERQNHMKDIQEGYIDPNKYWTGDKNGNGGHSRIAAGIGMILAGFNPTSRPNAAIDFLKHQMDMNIDAQKANLGAKQNLLAANLRQFGNLKDATEMTRIMQNDVITNQLQSAMAKAQTPVAAAEMQKAIGQFQTDSSQRFMQLSMRHAMMNLANDPNGQSPGAIEKMIGYMQVANPEMAKDMRSRFVPGMGLASAPVSEQVRGQLTGRMQFQQAVDDMRQWAAKHSGALDPRITAEGRTKAANLQNLYRESINGGVFKAGEQQFINGIVDADPTKFFNNIRVLPKLNEVARENAMGLNVLKRQVGLPVQQQAAQQQQANEPVMHKNGKMYIRQGNYMVPVK